MWRTLAEALQWIPKLIQLDLCKKLNEKLGVAIWLEGVGKELAHKYCNKSRQMSGCIRDFRKLNLLK